jgi:hypothetical protein
MAHYAFIKDNIVTEVIVGKDETEDTPNGFTSWEDYYLTFRSNQDLCKRTSYNTYKNQHTNSGTAFRGNFACIGFIYDNDNDVFYETQPFDSWTLNTSTWSWEAPTPMPTDDNLYNWNESTETWEQI